MSSFSRCAAVVAAVAVLASGCERSEILLPERGVLTFAVERDGAEGWKPTNVVDFGLQATGSVTSLKLLARNEGNVALVIDRAELVGGDAVRFGDAVPAGEAFVLEYSPGTRLDRGASSELRVTFTAPSVEAPAELRAHIRLLATDDKKQPISEELILRARVDPALCDLPESLSFGKLSRGDVARQNLVLHNPTSQPVFASIGPVTSSSGGAGAFTYASEGETPGPGGAEWLVPAGGSRVVEVAFKPAEEGAYLASLRIDTGIPGCEETVVTLEGTGVASVLTWAPVMVDCGWVPPGTSVERTLTFTNEGEVSVELTNLRSTNMTEVQVAASTLVVPPRGGTAEVAVTCSPKALGPRQTTLTFQTDLPTLPGGQVQVRVWGGGPEIEVEPFPLLDFGRVPLVAATPGGPAQPGSFAQRTLRVMNVGTQPAVPDVRANLRLGVPDENGDPTPGTLFLVEPLDANTSPGEFEVVVPSSYDPWKGLVARAGENTLELFVTLRPVSAGTKRAKLTIFSNDLDEGELEVTVTAEVVEVASCRYAIQGAAPGLDFGVITPPLHSEQALRFVNLGTSPDEVCFVA